MAATRGHFRFLTWEFMAKSKPEAQFNPVNLSEILGELEKAVKIQSITIGEENRVSTGLLCVDLLLGGGITAGMYTVAGPEQSAKTTLTLAILAASVRQQVGARVLWDAENSSGSSMDYVENIFNATGVNADIETLFGVKEKGKYTTEPLIYYRDEGEMDTFYNWLSGFLRRLPDKRFEAGTWWYVYQATPENKSKYKGTYDRRMSAAQGALYIPAPDGALQAMVMVDSYPSLLPTSMDEDDPKAGMALQAREFSRHIPRVKGKLRSKRVALLGINQLREAPAVMFKDPNYEPGGQALRFNCMSADTLLLTDRGMLTAAEYSLTPTPGKLCGRKGLETPTGFEEKGYSEIYELRTTNGIHLRGKPGHKVLTLRESDLTPEFRDFKTLSTHAASPGAVYVAVKLGMEVFPKTNPKFDFHESTTVAMGTVDAAVPKEMTVELAYVLGVLVGDGWIRDGAVGLCNRSPHVIAKFSKLCRNLFSVQARFKTSKQNSFYGGGFYSSKVGQFLAYLGVGQKSSHTKEIPWCVRQGTREVQASFLAGHFDTDKFHTSSRKMQEQLVTTLLNFGVLTGKTVRERENFFKHGELFSFEKNSRKFNKNSLKAGVFSLPIYNPYLAKLIDVLKPYLADSKLTEKKGVRANSRLSRVSPNRDGGLSRVLPLGDKPFRKEGSKLAALHRQLYVSDPKENRSRNLYLDERGLVASQKMRALVPSQRTPQERESSTRALDKYEALIRLCQDESLVFVRVDYVSHFVERSMTYDGNMPETSTIITNGIVSHNSDVRLRAMPRALSGVPDNPKGKGQIEKEASASGEGEDTYRYIHLKAIKNKLSVPNRETWLRIWVEDENSQAQGFCPVWDTFYALSMTGQVSGKRSAMTLDIHGLGKAKRSLTWEQFKALILGDKATVTTICTKLGYKPFNLRKGLFNLTRKGVMEKLYSENHKKKLSEAKTKAKEVLDDDVEVEDDDE